MMMMSIVLSPQGLCRSRHHAFPSSTASLFPEEPEAGAASWMDECKYRHNMVPELVPNRQQLVQSRKGQAGLAEQVRAVSLGNRRRGGTGSHQCPY